jgi:ribonuclease J
MANPVLTVHRATSCIGGNCVEIGSGSHRLILDAGSPLDTAAPPGPVPATLDLSSDVDAVVVSHPHQDHFGIVGALPPHWPVWAGASAEILMRLTAAIGGTTLGPVHTYTSFVPFTIGPFVVTPLLTDHSAFDAHMLLVEVGARRILYSGDFRRTGRKASLVDSLLRQPPADVDVLLLEGTALGRVGEFPTEAELEERFVDLFRSRGRVFVTWSAQNIDRTVTLYRACKRTDRTLVLDLYAADVLRRLAPRHEHLPRLGWPNLAVVITVGMKRLYGYPAQLDDAAYVEECARSGHAFGASKLEPGGRDVIMLRPSLLRDYERKGVVLGPDDTWVFSMWDGYLNGPEYETVRQRFDSVGAVVLKIHTSGHASPADLERFAAAIAPRHLVPIHGEAWDQHLGKFRNVARLRDGEPFEIE